jgi:hypothetical protein
VSFVDSLRLAIALGLTLFLVLLRFDSDRIIRSDYFRYRTPWMGPVSYYILVIGFAIGIAIILPSDASSWSSLAATPAACCRSCCCSR